MAAFEQYRVPFLHEKRIEDEAELLLNEWAEMQNQDIVVPVPIEDILELHLGLAFSLADLQKEFGHRDVLGAIWFGDKEVKVDKSLSPDDNPKMLGRFRFTIAHEIGHWRLHKSHLMENPAALHLFQEKSEPAFVQRSSQNPPEEKQANMFAAALLMPQQQVFDAWMKWRGNCNPVGINELMDSDSASLEKLQPDVAVEQFCRPLAQQFEVSAQAMHYRLKKLELVVPHSQPRLF